MAGVRHVFAPRAQGFEPASSLLRDPAAWPGFWLRQWQRIKIRPTVVITYADLWRDLSGQGPSWRGPLWRKFLGLLSWPSGTMAFWPLSEPGATGLADLRLDFFVAGLSLMRPAYLLFFGQEAVSQAFPDGRAPTRLALGPDGEARVLVFPEPERLADAEDPAFSSLLAAARDFTLPTGQLSPWPEPSP